MHVFILATGVASGTLALVVFFGWVARAQPLVQVIPGSSSMTLSTATLFLLCGSVLVLLAEKRAQAFAGAVAAAIAALAAAILFQHATGVALGIDLPRLHDWIADGNPAPGRTSVFSACAFLSLGLGALVLGFSRRSWRFAAAEAAGWIAGAIALINFLGYALLLEDLYALLQVNRMAPHTSVGVIALSAGLLASARLHQQRAAVPAPPAGRILGIAVALLAGACTLVGGAVFAMMQRDLQKGAADLLLNTLQERRQYVISLLELRDSEAARAAINPRLRAALRAGDVAATRAALSSLVVGEAEGLAVQDAGGRELARAGRFAEKFERAIDLRFAREATLIAAGANLYLRVRMPIRDGETVLGTLLAEQRMPRLSRLLLGEPSYGRTGETVLCYRRAAGLACFPSRLTERAFEPPAPAPGRSLPMEDALAGSTGVIRTRDYRGASVIAAYGPVGVTGLGMVVKVDTVELLAPARDDLVLLAAVMLAVITLGAWLLRSRVHPLAVQLSLAEQEARAAHARLQKIADNIPALVAQVGTDLRYRFANRTYEDWFGLRHDELVGGRLQDVWPPQHYARIAPAIAKALAGERAELEQTVASRQGTRTLRTSLVPDVDAGGTVSGLFLLASDISEQVEARKALGRALQRLDLALDASRVAVWEADLSSGEVVLSDAWAEMLGRPAGETRTTLAELNSLVHPEDAGRVLAHSDEVTKGSLDRYAIEHRVRAESGDWLWILSRGRVVERDPANRHALRLIGTNLDITERKQGEIRMEALANYDSLTGCANRNLFADRVAQAIARCRRSGASAALMYLDLDRFKEINDNLGHAAGDALLKECAARVQAAIRETDTVGRLGGDEFAVLLENVTDIAAPQAIAQKILEAMRTPVPLEGRSVVVTASIGMVLFGADAAADRVARSADAALYEAKAAGRNTYRVAP